MKTPIMSKLENGLKLLGLATLALLTLCLPPTAAGADWNNAYGMGNPADDWAFSGTGVPLSVVPGVQSNAVYYVTSASSSGIASVRNVWFKNDTLSSLNWYVSTNSWQCASNQPAGTNLLWLSTTNSGLATNDILVLQSRASDSYQLLVLSGNATSSSGLVATNALGQNLIKVFNTPSNTITAGDTIHKMALVASFTPLSMGVVTNQINAVPGDHVNQWLKFGGKETVIPFRARFGLPALMVLNTSNSAGLYLEGEYFVRPRR